MIGPESRFTKPSPFCPRPELWSSYDCDSTEVEVIALVRAFVTALKPELVLETGTSYGFMARSIGEALLENGNGGRLITLERNPQTAAMAREKLAGSALALPVEVVETDSANWTPPGPIGFAWLDSGIHVRQEELNRLRLWLVGAIVGVHDTGPQHPVRGYLEKEAPWFRPIYLRTPRGVCFGEVTA